MNDQQINFLKLVISPARQQQFRFGLPESVTIAQAILESATSKGWGTSRLFLEASNPFGIKYSHSVIRDPDRQIPQEEYTEFNAETWEIENGQKKEIDAAFQRFPDLEAAFYAHGRLLLGERYRAAFAARGSWKLFAERLGPKTFAIDKLHCGYSTNPDYGKTLVNLIESARLDNPVQLDWYAKVTIPAPQIPSLEGVAK